MTVQIGYKKKYELKNVKKFLKKYEVTVLKKHGEKNNFKFIEICTKNLKNGHCSLSLFYAVDDEITKNLYDLAIENKHPEIAEFTKRGREENKKFLLEDADWWMNFIKSFVDEYDEICIYMHLKKAKLDNGIIEKYLNELIRDDLLKLNINQKLVVKNKPDSSLYQNGVNFI